MRPCRDAKLVVVTSNTGAIGPRLLPRGPPGPKAAPSLLGIWSRLVKNNGPHRPPPITTGPSGPQSSTVFAGNLVSTREEQRAPSAPAYYHGALRAPKQRLPASFKTEGQTIDPVVHVLVLKGGTKRTGDGNEGGRQLVWIDVSINLLSRPDDGAPEDDRVTE